MDTPTVLPVEPPRQPDDALWDLNDAASFLKVSRQTVRRLVRRGEIPFTRVGIQIRFVPEVLRRWAESPDVAA